MTDNTYSLASPNHDLYRGYRVEQMSGESLVDYLVDESDAINSTFRSAKDFRRIRAEILQRLDQGRQDAATLETIANSMERADAAQKFELEKAELVNALRCLVGVFLTGDSTISRSLLRATASFKNAERVIAKYEAK